MREEQERERASAVVREASEGTMTEYLMLALEVEGQQYASFPFSIFFADF
jgi:hypothetical protein